MTYAALKTFFARRPTYISGVRSTSVIPAHYALHTPPAVKPNGGLRGSTATRWQR